MESAGIVSHPSSYFPHYSVMQPDQTLPDHSFQKQLKPNIEIDALLIGYLTLCNAIDDQRWITVVADSTIDLYKYKSIINQYSRLRVIQSDASNALWVSWQCLAQGNSQAVIVLLDSIEQCSKQHLLNAASIGNSALYVIETQ